MADGCRLAQDKKVFRNRTSAVLFILHAEKHQDKSHQVSCEVSEETSSSMVLLRKERTMDYNVREAVKSFTFLFMCLILK